MDDLEEDTLLNTISGVPDDAGEWPPFTDVTVGEQLLSHHNPTNDDDEDADDGSERKMIVTDQEQGVLSRMQYYTRKALLEDIAALQSSTSIWLASNISLIGRHQQFIQEGCFLWELIHPQINLDEMERDGEGDGEGDDGMVESSDIPTSSSVFGYPIWNPNGRYIVKLFYDGKWRMIQ
ncbi:hypothetical protein FOZ62_010503, partial [Perkinsus olseni]